MGFKTSKSPRTHPTPFGEFIQENGGWEGYIEILGNEVRIFADDINGTPNPKLLHIIPLIQQKLSHFESMARQSVDALSPQYEFDSVDIRHTNPETDFSLVFVCSADSWSGAINVEFKDGKITAWWAAD